MNAFVQGVKSLFTGPDTKAEDQQIAEAKDAQTGALARQQQTAQQQEQLANVQAGLVARTPRGRRLLMAATGDGGVTGGAAGTNTTLG